MYVGRRLFGWDDDVEVTHILAVCQAIGKRTQAGPTTGSMRIVRTVARRSSGLLRYIR